MTDAAVFQATVHGFRTVPTRKVVQVTIEAPIEQHARIAEIAEHGAWVAVARLEKGGEADTDRTQLRHSRESNSADNTPPSPSQSMSTAAGAKSYSLPQRVAMVCNEPGFWRFLSEELTIAGFGYEDFVSNPMLAADTVRSHCGVRSRRQILPGTEAAKKWEELSARYEGWKRGIE